VLPQVVLSSSISILKQPATQQIDSGSAATFKITVTNTGETRLTNVKVTDLLSPDCDKTIGALAAGAKVTYTCTKANVTAAFTNVAVATGKTPSGGTVTSRDSAKVNVTAPFKPPAPPTHPKITIVKNPKSQTVDNGGTAVFTITVTNSGDVKLLMVNVSDPTSPQCNKKIGELDPGDTKTYTCMRPNVTKSFTNVATGRGTAPNGKKVSDTDQAPVSATAPFKPPAPPKVVTHQPPKATG
jgi:uncharacterized repeat protein (TIGR01451 family)